MSISGCRLVILKSIIENCNRLSDSVIVRLTKSGLIVQSKNQIDNSLIQATLYSDSMLDVDVNAILPCIVDYDELKFTFELGQIHLNGVALKTTIAQVYDITNVEPVNTCSINTIELSHLFMCLALSAHSFTIVCKNGMMSMVTPTVTAKLKNVSVNFDCEFAFIVKVFRTVSFSTLNCIRNAEISISKLGLLKISCDLSNYFGKYSLLLSPIANKN